MGCILSNGDIQYQSFNFSGLNEFIKNTIIMKVSHNPRAMSSRSKSFFHLFSAFSIQMISYSTFSLLAKITLWQQMSIKKTVIFFLPFINRSRTCEAIETCSRKRLWYKTVSRWYFPRGLYIIKIYKLMMSHWILNFESLILCNGNNCWL